MTVSNEPGYYADGRFGIRIENIVLVRDVKTPNNFGDKGYLGFEHVTMSGLLLSHSCPYQSHMSMQVSNAQESHRCKFIDGPGAQVAKRLPRRGLGQGLAIAAE
jgi:hypothetical protein